MTIFFDFDGTLTKNGFPIYPILEKCGIPLNDFYHEILKEEDIYLSLCQVFTNILKSHNYDINDENISYGADKITFNPGVKEFLKYLTNQKIDNIILTSGFEEFVKKISIAKYFKDIFGTKIDKEGNPTFILRDKTKSTLIKKYISDNNLKGQSIVYIGDGFTDKFAFEYVKSIGGSSILVYDINNEKDIKIKKEFTDSGIITISFPKDYTKSSELFLYINNLSKGEK